MNQLVILSGKGGTGKTSISASFAHLASLSGPANSAVLADADVDAANLRLVMDTKIEETREFMGGSLAEINPDLCIDCGKCATVCRYDAALHDPVRACKYWVDPIACDGCAACVYACPTQAIKMNIQHEGQWFRSWTPYGTLFHAELFPGRENSGKLVTLVKQNARLWAEDHQTPLVIIDGPPGIGCPVISACAGADMSVIVTEPGQAGLHDLKRIRATLQHFCVKHAICINKADLYTDGTQQIRDYADENEIPILGEIPFDESISRAMLDGLPVTMEYPDSRSALAIKHVWESTVDLVKTLEE